MKAVAGHVAVLTRQYSEYGHPIDLTHALEPEYHTAATKVTNELSLADPIPPLCTLVCASPFDAALHDGFGKMNGLNAYRTYGPDFVSHDLGHYLGAEFAGLPLDRFVLTTAKPTMPLYHLVGALDPLLASEVVKPVGDGLPETLGEWIKADGLTHLKIKLNGENLDWDVGRVLTVDRIATETNAKRGVTQWFYSLDFNEKCQSVEYLLEFLNRVGQGFADEAAAINPEMACRVRLLIWVHGESLQVVRRPRARRLQTDGF